MSRNLLDREISPYLLQHKDNPVHWRPWGAEALAEAARVGKPILLSVGYAACHWCHVMAHESFEDPETAELMNRDFVNIKVDREERPEIDIIYQTALALLGQQGGWPLTMFLSPDGAPFWGGTYFPPESRFGRPGFRDLLRRVRELHASNDAALAKNRGALTEGLAKILNAPPDQAAAPITPALLDEAAAHLVTAIDRRHGGLEGAPKFPLVPLFELIWRAHLRGGQAAYRQAVLVTLEGMCQGGIYDHLGGGFARYSTDPYWLVPHFEKMLYDNAQLLELLCLVWQHDKNPLWQARVRETVAWLEREMVAEGGGFAATLDADSDGVEGKFYVWSEAEIDALLGDESTSFKTAYGVTPGSNWEGTCILNGSARPELGSEDDETALAASRAILLKARGARVRPGWDDKVLADWNGLMIAALANAALVFGEGGWLAAARRAFAFVRDEMTVDGRLRHSHRRGQARHPALLDDYANMVRAALTLFEATGEADYLAQAEAWVAVLERHYWDGENNGYFSTADDAEALIVRTRSATDGAVPAGNATIVAALARLYAFSGEERYRARAQQVIAAFAGAAGANSVGHASLLNAFEVLASTQQVVIVGRRGEKATEALMGVVLQTSLPNRALLVVASDAGLPVRHPAHGKGQVTDEATAYVCLGSACSLPVTAPHALPEALPQPPGPVLSPPCPGSRSRARSAR